MPKKAKPNKTDLSRIVEPLHSLATRMEELHPDVENAVVHDKESIDSVARSLSTYGQDQPIVVQKEGMIVRKGNGRFSAARKLGWKWIAAVVVDEENVGAISRAIADNRSSEFRKWNYERLFAVLEWMKNAGWQEEDMGYTQEEMRDLVQKYQEEPDLELTGGIDLENGGGTGEVEVPSVAHVRMAILMFTEDSHQEFTELAEKLGEIYESDNQSDTVLLALEECDQRQQDP